MRQNSNSKIKDMKVSLADQKVSMELQGLACDIDKALEKIAGQKMGFSLVVFNAQAGSRMNYISNCDRQEVASALTSLLAGWKQGMPDVKAHDVQ